MRYFEEITDKSKAPPLTLTGFNISFKDGSRNWREYLDNRLSCLQHNPISGNMYLHCFAFDKKECESPDQTDLKFHRRIKEKIGSLFEAYRKRHFLALSKSITRHFFLRDTCLVLFILPGKPLAPFPAELFQVVDGNYSSDYYLEKLRKIVLQLHGCAIVARQAGDREIFGQLIEPRISAIRSKEQGVNAVDGYLLDMEVTESSIVNFNIVQTRKTLKDGEGYYRDSKLGRKERRPYIIGKKKNGDDAIDVLLHTKKSALIRSHAIAKQLLDEADLQPQEMLSNYSHVFHNLVRPEQNNDAITICVNREQQEELASLLEPRPENAQRAKDRAECKHKYEQALHRIQEYYGSNSEAINASLRNTQLVHVNGLEELLAIAQSGSCLFLDLMPYIVLLQEDTQEADNTDTKYDSEETEEGKGFSDEELKQNIFFREKGLWKPVKKRTIEEMFSNENIKGVIEASKTEDKWDHSATERYDLYTRLKMYNLYCGFLGIKGPVSQNLRIDTYASGISSVPGERFKKKTQTSESDADNGSGTVMDKRTTSDSIMNKALKELDIKTHARDGLIHELWDPGILSFVMETLGSRELTCVVRHRITEGKRTTLLLAVMKLRLDENNEFTSEVSIHYLSRLRDKRGGQKLQDTEMWEDLSSIAGLPKNKFALKDNQKTQISIGPYVISIMDNRKVPTHIHVPSWVQNYDEEAEKTWGQGRNPLNSSFKRGVFQDDKACYPSPDFYAVSQKLTGNKNIKGREYLLIETADRKFDGITSTHMRVLPNRCQPLQAGDYQPYRTEEIEFALHCDEELLPISRGKTSPDILNALMASYCMMASFDVSKEGEITKTPICAKILRNLID